MKESRLQVEVVVATYNGSPYLSQWIDSIANQSLPVTSIVAIDDASTDDTIAILEKERRVPVVVYKHTKNTGVRHSFENALSHSTAPYIFLADQDDVWHPDKIEIMTRAIMEAEQRLGPNHPVLVFCDLRIVDGNLNVIHPSFFRATSKNASARNPEDFIISNHVPGCAMALNRALLSRLLPMPAETYIHDWWIALVAATMGTIIHVDQPLIDWRQHGGNTLGSPNARLTLARQVIRYATRLFSWADRFRDYQKQATVIRSNISGLREAFGAQLPPATGVLLDRLESSRWRVRRAALTSAQTGESVLARWIITALLGRSVRRAIVNVTLASKETDGITLS